MVVKVYDAKNFSLMEGEVFEDATATSSRDFRLKILLPKFIKWSPGQFVMLRWGRHLVARPFAIVDWKSLSKGSLLEVWVRRLGAGTEELFKLAKKGMAIHVTAPLGQNFMEKQKLDRILFLSGGVGAASILPVVAARLAVGQTPSDLWIHGEQDENSLDRQLMSSESRPQILYFEKTSVRGLSGRITQAFDGKIDERLEDSFQAVVACGPSAMLEAVVAKLQGDEKFSQIPLWLGLEEKMGCGVGLCFSCSVSTQKGMERCCLEGPWFEAGHLKNHFVFRKTGAL